MIVQCPSCAARYRVNDANIPPSGGKIRCPSCAHAFVVYPPAPDEGAGDTDRTSIAQKPNLKNLLNSMKSAEANTDEGGRTEVMSGDNVPDFNSLLGNMPEGDKTVEMSNPLMDEEFRRAMLGQTAAAKEAAAANATSSEDELMTQELTSDLVNASLEGLRDQARGAPIEEEEELATQIAPPLEIGEPPSGSPSFQQRISAPDGPTPPPGQEQRSSSGGPLSPPTQPVPQVIEPPQSSSSGPATRFPTTPPVDRLESSPGSPAGTPPPRATGFGSTPVPAGASGADPNHQGPWHLQTPFGIVYNFQDMQGLRNHLEPKDSLEGYRLSVDGMTFFGLEEFPQVQVDQLRRSGPRQTIASGPQAAIPEHVSATGPQPEVGPGSSGPQPRPGPGPGGPGPVGSGPQPGVGQGFPGGPAPARSPFTTANQAVAGPGPNQPRQLIDPNAAVGPPSRGKSQRILNFFLWLLLLVLVVVAFGLALHLGGIVDLFGEEEQVQPTTQVVVPEVQEEVEEERPEEDPETAEEIRERVDRLLSEAEAEIEANRLPRAMSQLERVIQLDPNRIQAYTMLADLHETFEEHEEAEVMRERARRLREGLPLEDDPDEAAAEEASEEDASDEEAAAEEAD